MSSCVLPKEPAIQTDDTGTITFSQLRQLAASWARVLHKCGLVKGDSILVSLPNCNEYAIVFLASAALGVAISGISNQTNISECQTSVNFCQRLDFSKLFPVNSPLKIMFILGELQHYIERSNANLMICDTDVYTELADNGFPVFFDFSH